jgi:hypothetical protein
MFQRASPASTRRSCQTLGATVSVLFAVGRAIKKAFGYRFLEISEDLPHRITLRYGKTTTTFDRTTARVEQNGKLVAMIGLVERVELRQPLNQEGPPNWYVTVHIAGRRQVEVGQVTAELEASIAGARISSITERPVVMNA